ncbi:MAG: aminotransferase class III-fold pyridoxal phosphate-dependent enzyme, partial [Elusimicrobia bacterium]|nr:aminotransferase class III-fold pyridoxal phosphate-dependent enzyme [Candidatus Obscuribacterium magneticum]
AIQRQAAKFIHVSNYYYTTPQTALAKALTRRAPGFKVFFSNSGAEANELAIKLARLWATKEGKKGREIITFYGAFHGRTLATAAAGNGQKGRNRIYAPLPSGFRSVPFNDLTALKSAISSRTIAVMIEPIQGEGGIHVATTAFLKGIQALCRRHRLLFIVDEVQCGMGRTGTFFAYEQAGVKPHLIALAKGLAGGLPLGATLAAPAVSRPMTPGLHGSTFGGNPVACAASLEVLKMLDAFRLKSINKLGEVLGNELRRFYRYPVVKEIRGRGLMWGLELAGEGAPYVSLAREKGLLINCTQEKVLRFLPPYVLTRGEMEKAVAILEDVFQELGNP